jgi:hypothetical protein
MRPANKLLLRRPDRASHTPEYREPCIEKHYSVSELAVMWNLSALVRNYGDVFG